MRARTVFPLQSKRRRAEKRRLFWRATCLTAALTLISQGISSRAATKSASDHAVDFNRDIRPILSENCYKCHGPDDEARKAKLRFDLQGEALKPAKSGNIAIVPGSPEKSELIARITATDPDDRMPPLKTGKKLTAKMDRTGRAVRDALGLRKAVPTSFADREEQALAAQCHRPIYSGAFREGKPAAFTSGGSRYTYSTRLA